MSGPPRGGRRSPRAAPNRGNPLGDTPLRVDPETWAPPPAPAAPARGVLGGDRLLDQPAHAALARQLDAFVAPGGPPVVLEIGVDRGWELLAAARACPERRFLGLELRRTVLPAIGAGPERVPDNALLMRMDARTVLPRVPPGRLIGVEVRFPTPSHDPRHLLFTPAVAAAIGRALYPRGSLYVVTDVPGFLPLLDALFDGWPPAAPPAPRPLPSRREAACAAAGIPTFWRAWGPPPLAPGGAPE